MKTQELKMKMQRKKERSLIASDKLKWQKDNIMKQEKTNDNPNKCPNVFDKEKDVQNFVCHPKMIPETDR